MQPAQLGAGLDADLLHERRPRLPIRLQRLGLPPGAVEREHPLAVQAFTQRVLADQPVELAGQLGVAPGRQVGVDRHVGGAQPQILEAPDLGCGERLVGQVRQRLAPPQRQRLARTRLLQQPLHACHVDAAVGELQLVTAAVGDDSNAVAVERASQMRHVELHHLRRARRRPIAPQSLGQAVGRDRPPRFQREHREHRPLLARAQLDRPVPEANLERP